MITVLLAFATLSGPLRVVDGDTLRAGSERIRLLGIDAPDDPRNGRCRPFPKPGAICDKKRSVAATTSLAAAVTPFMQIERVGRDRYGRTLGVVRSSLANLSCWQLRRGQAVYHPEWDNGGRIAKACRSAAQ
jgi:endonuclease YncB( thermonuclease family)